MILRHASVFAQLLDLIPRAQFDALVRRHGAEDRTKGFSSWDQFVAMLFCQLGQAHSLREIVMGLATCLGKLVHLGVKEAPKRSTLAYANAHRPWRLYQDVFALVLESARPYAKGKGKLRFRNKLYSMDATVIDLCLEMYDWARFRRTQGAVKLHLVLDHEGYLPVFAHITDGKTHEVTMAQRLSLPPGASVATSVAAAVLLVGGVVSYWINYEARQRAEAQQARAEENEGKATSALAKVQEEQTLRREQQKLSAPALLDKARREIAEKRIDDALRDVTIACDFAPDSADAWLLRAELTAAKRDFASALSALEPLRGMPLDIILLHCCDRVQDLSPLAGMKLRTIAIEGTAVADLTPLEGMSLEKLSFEPRKIKKGIEIIRNMKNLQGIGDRGGDRMPSPAEFWKKYDAGEFK